MEIGFSDLIFGRNTSGSIVSSEIEGRLWIRVGNDVLFDEQHVLVVELAYSLADWIGSGGDFYYFSMDYEEGPIISFVEESEGWHLASTWSDRRFDNVMQHDFLCAAEVFLAGMADALRKADIHFYWHGGYQGDG